MAEGLEARQQPPPRAERNNARENTTEPWPKNTVLWFLRRFFLGHPLLERFVVVVLVVVLVPVLLFGWLALIFGCLALLGPTGIADTLFYWRKRRNLRKELVSSSRPIAIHIVNRRQSNGGHDSFDEFFVTLGYRMDGTSYASKKEIEVSKEIYTLPDGDGTPKLIVFDCHKLSNLPHNDPQLIPKFIVFYCGTSLQWKDGYFWGRVSSQHPASGPLYSHAPLSFGDYSFCCGDSFCVAACRFPVFLLFAAFMPLWAVTIAGAAPRWGLLLDPVELSDDLDYCVTAGVLLLIGVLAAVALHVAWLNETLNAYQIVDDLPAGARDDEEERVGALETGVPVGKVDDEAATEVAEELSDDDTAESGDL